MKVYIVTVTNAESGGVLFQEVCATDKVAIDELWRYCREAWQGQVHENEPLSRRRDEAIEQYFEFWDEEERFNIEGKVVVEERPKKKAGKKT